MKRSNVPVQSDLFTDPPAMPALTSLQQNHEELVDLLSRLLWEVTRPNAPATRETGHE